MFTSVKTRPNFDALYYGKGFQPPCARRNKPLQRTRALIRRTVKRAGPSKKVWCSRLGSTKTRRFQIIYTVELRFLNNLHETPSTWIGEFFAALFVLRQWEKVSFTGMKTGLKISCCEWVRSRASWTRKLLTYEYSFYKKALFSGIELICEFLRTMLNNNQFLLSIVFYSFYLFGEFEEVLILRGKCDAYN